MATFTVTTLSDSGPGSLREAILQANGRPGPDRIEFAAGLTGTIVLGSPLPTITDPLEIDGPGASTVAISGNSSRQILTVDRGVNVSIHGLTFENGSSAEGGGAVLNRGRLTLTSCAFRANQAVGDGGAILNDRGILIVRDSSFDVNHSELDGGAIANTGGDVLVEGSVFTANTADFFGGAVYTLLGQTAVRTSHFSGHSAIFGGTVMLIGHRLEMTDCTVADSFANSEGGAVRVSGEAEITGCTFLRNRCLTFGGAVAIDRGGLRLTSSTLISNQASLDGGAVASFTATSLITRCILRENSASDSGGAIAALDEVLRVEDCDLIENTAGFNGGGIASMDNQDGTWVGVRGCNLVENTAAVAGGGVFTRNGLTEVTDSAVVRNTAVLGGGVYNSVGAMTRLLNVTLSQNRADQGGAIFAADPMVEASFVTVNETVVDPVVGAAVAGRVGETNIFLANSILASTTDEQGNPRPNCGGGVINLGGNFSTDDSCPGSTVVLAEELALGPLEINAPGRTYTHALGKGSRAIDGARGCQDAALQPVRADQRGVRRPQGRTCDSGAYERVEDPKPKRHGAYGDHDEHDASDSSDSSGSSGR